MKLRVSNGYTRAVEFSAGNQREFDRALRRAMFEYFSHGDRHAQLHVMTDTGNWLSPNYPRSNAAMLVPRGAAPVVKAWLGTRAASPLRARRACTSALL